MLIYAEKNYISYISRGRCIGFWNYVNLDFVPETTFCKPMKAPALAYETLHGYVQLGSVHFGIANTSMV
jgi:hypothetical protein